MVASLCKYHGLFWPQHYQHHHNGILELVCCQSFLWHHTLRPYHSNLCHTKVNTAIGNFLSYEILTSWLLFCVCWLVWNVSFKSFESTGNWACLMMLQSIYTCNNCWFSTLPLYLSIHTSWLDSFMWLMLEKKSLWHFASLCLLLSC